MNNDNALLRTRIIELEVAAQESLKLIEWFQEILNNRDEPVRYDPIGLQKYPMVFNVNHDREKVEEIKNFLRAVLEDKPTCAIEHL